ncbi:MAG: GNAT family N-acetyltransferase [Bacteroidota bacterium]
MINSLVRAADLNDHQQLSNLIFFETHLHRHLDWRSPLEWLGAPFYWALEEDRQITAALACPTEVEGIAWVRLFVYTGHWTPENAWAMLWPAAREEISRAGGATVAAIAMQPWFQTILAENHFENRQQIVMLEWHSRPWTSTKVDGVRIRRMMESDIPGVTRADHAAFTPLWHNSLDTLQRAFSQALFATVAETRDEIIGYQLTTGHGQRAHLARLAVHPAMQGRGVGHALLSDLYANLMRIGTTSLSVNTQSDNQVSLKLYKNMGFTRTGEEYPVYTFEVPTAFSGRTTS